MLNQTEKLSRLSAYQLVEEREIHELNSIGYILERNSR